MDLDRVIWEFSILLSNFSKSINLIQNKTKIKMREKSLSSFTMLQKANNRILSGGAELTVCCVNVRCHQHSTSVCALGQVLGSWV